MDYLPSAAKSNCQDLWIGDLGSLLEQCCEERVLGVDVDGHPLAQEPVLLVVEPVRALGDDVQLGERSRIRLVQAS